MPPERYLISTDSALLDLYAIHAYLSQSYWSPGIPREVVEKGIKHSMCFGVYDQESRRPDGKPVQIGLCRVITDRATFAYLSDVYILEAHRGQGLSKRLMEAVLSHPDLRVGRGEWGIGIRRFCLLTKDAHGMYAQHGFKPMEDPTRYMERTERDIYGAPA